MNEYVLWAAIFTSPLWWYLTFRLVLKYLCPEPIAPEKSTSEMKTEIDS